MERKTIHDNIYLRIPVQTDSYRVEIPWSAVLKIEGILPTDTVCGIQWEKDDSPGFGGNDVPDPHYVPYLQVRRYRPETDKELEGRAIRESNETEMREERDRIEYIRLKAKFDLEWKENKQKSKTS